MEIPTSLRGEEDMCDEHGVPFIIELHTPIWGEIEAGFEWHDEFHVDLVSWGWTPCEGVPALYHHGNARLGTIVDDFLISEDSSSGEIAERTLQTPKAVESLLSRARDAFRRAAATFALLRQQRLHVDRHLPFPRATEE